MKINTLGIMISTATTWGGGGGQAELLTVAEFTEQ